jgi:aminomethyltransferase
MVERAVPRHGYPILHDAGAVGVVTSGSYGPSVDRYIGIGYVPTSLAAVGTGLAVDVRGRPQSARVVKTPFHPPRVKKA